ncbi:MAG: hypothetical protein AAGA03_12115 [Planctomycetota bacterium]
MALQIGWTAFLAETRISDVSLRFREEAVHSGTPWWFAIIPVLAIGAALAIYRIANQPRPTVNTPYGMLAEICARHQIHASGRRLLERIAEEANLAQPAALMLGVTHFEAAVAKAGRTIQYDRRQKATLKYLRRRLFA